LFGPFFLYACFNIDALGTSTHGFLCTAVVTSSCSWAPSRCSLA
jgi:hypothetical protein